VMELQASPTYAFISTTSTTYHPENPFENAIIDNPGLVRRRRRKTSARELEILEMAFRENEKPSKEARDQIARQTGMDGKAVQVLSLFTILYHTYSSIFHAHTYRRYGSRINDNPRDVYRNPQSLIKVPSRL